MKMNLASMGLLLVLCAACGTDSGSPSDGDSSDAGTGGTGGPGAGGVGPGSGGLDTSGGASGGGGGASSGTGGSNPGAGGADGPGAGGSGFDPAAHCGPGEYFREGFLEAELASQCVGAQHDQAIANGIGPGADYVDIWSVHLSTPMRIGEPTAFSRELYKFAPGSPADTQIEYWAAAEPCGASGSIVKFYEEPVASTRVYCGSITPTAEYSYIVQVVRPLPSDAANGLSYRGATVCATGTCPAP